MKMEGVQNQRTTSQARNFAPVHLAIVGVFYSLLLLMILFAVQRAVQNYRALANR